MTIIGALILAAVLILAIFFGLFAWGCCIVAKDYDAVNSPEAREAAGTPCVFVEEEQ